jgi:hypothetical protein
LSSLNSGQNKHRKDRHAFHGALPSARAKINVREQRLGDRLQGKLIRINRVPVLVAEQSAQKASTSQKMLGTSIDCFPQKVPDFLIAIPL